MTLHVLLSLFHRLCLVFTGLHVWGSDDRFWLNWIRTFQSVFWFINAKVIVLHHLRISPLH